MSNRRPALQAGPGPDSEPSRQPQERPPGAQPLAEQPSWSPALRTLVAGPWGRRRRRRRRRARDLFVRGAARTRPRPPRDGDGGGAARRRGRIPGSDATAGARGAFPPLANGSAVARVAGSAATPAPPPGPRPWTVRAPSDPVGWPLSDLRGRGGSPPRAAFCPLSAPRGAAQGAAGRMVCGAGRAARGLTQFPLSVEGVSDSLPSLGGRAG